MQNVPEKRVLDSSDIYAQAKEMAKSKRIEHGVRTSDLNVNALKKILKKEGVRVDLVTAVGNRIRAAYFSDEDGCSIMLKKGLPQEPKMFALAHELKHHLMDRELIAEGKIRCGDYNRNKVTEIAAEVFAAEFIFPEEEMFAFVSELDITVESCSKEKIIEIKRQSPVPISYIFIQKRLTRMGIIVDGQYKGVQFKKLEENLYPSLYKQPWFKNHRAKKIKGV
jgi:Zn-dependent peptidase ImmA (M78 family)